jgi:hypothetical protein
MAREIDMEIRGLIDEGRNKAKQLLNENRDKLEELTYILLDKETLSGDEFRTLVAMPARTAKAGKKLPAPQAVVAAVSEAGTAEAEAGEESVDTASAGTRLARKLKGIPRPALPGAAQTAEAAPDESTNSMEPA